MGGDREGGPMITDEAYGVNSRDSSQSGHAVLSDLDWSSPGQPAGQGLKGMFQHLINQQLYKWKICFTA